MLRQRASGQPVSASAARLAAAGEASRSARSAGPRPTARSPSDSTSQAMPEATSASPCASGRPKAIRAGFVGANGTNATRTPSAPVVDPKASTATATATTAATGTSARRERRTSQASANRQQELRRRERLQEPRAGSEHRGQDAVAAAFPPLGALERHHGREHRGHRGRDRVGEEHGLDEVRSELHRRVRRAEQQAGNEREVGRERQESREADGLRSEPERLRGSAQREHECDPPERHVEAADRVVRVDARPARRGRAHEVGPDVVAHRDAREPRDLRRPRRHELPGHADVHGRVHVLADVEPEGTVRVHAVRAVLGRGQHDDERRDRRQRAGERRPVRREPAGERTEEQRDERQRDERGEEQREAADQAQPVATRAEEQARWNDERGIDTNPREPLEPDPRARGSRAGRRLRTGASRGRDRRRRPGRLL